MQAFDGHRDEILMAHRHGGKLQPHEPGDMVGLGASRVDDIAARHPAPICMDRLDRSVTALDALDARRGRKPRAHVAALARIGPDDGVRSHSAVAGTPENGLYLAEIHSRP